MIWANFTDFFKMGGYSFYVWGSVFLTLALILGEFFLLKQARKNFLQSSQQQY